ncbi:MAG: hypothetical protein V7636_2846 [Actinomycetota bacterium]
MDRRASTDRRDLYNGFGDTMARAFEVVFTPFLFGLFGWWIDGRTHTRPLFALTLGILVLLYTLWKLSKGYVARMDAETEAVLRRSQTGKRS